jgi:hypothetical protein
MTGEIWGMFYGVPHRESIAMALCLLWMIMAIAEEKE